MTSSDRKRTSSGAVSAAGTEISFSLQLDESDDALGDDSHPNNVIVTRTNGEEDHRIRNHRTSGSLVREGEEGNEWWGGGGRSRHASQGGRGGGEVREVGGDWREDGEVGEGKQVKPRRSLLGRPINFKSRRRDARYRRLQAKSYNFLERPKEYMSTAYHLLVFLMVFLCLLLSVFSTIEEYEEMAGTFLYYTELLMVVWFTVEFIVRVWSAGCRSRYQLLTGRLQFIRRPLCIVDMIVILASIVILCLGASGQVFATSALRGLRFFQILRMVRVDRRGGSWKLLGSVIWAHRQELFTTLYIGFLGLIFSSFLMYLAEKERNPKKFGTYADSLWWGVITLCTVGYGDSVPITWPGKLVAAFCAILGISFFALPAGILGSGFALKVQQQQRQKHLIRRKGPAAVLIQSLWRCYAADEHSSSIATWTPHIKAFKANQRLSTRSKDSAPLPLTASFAPSLQGLASPLILRRTGGSARHNSTGTTSSTTSVPPSAGVAEDKDVEYNETYRSHLSLNDFTGSNLFSSLLKRTPDGKDSEDDIDDSEHIVVTSLTLVHKRVIRSLRKIRFFVARRKFREAFRPYDVKDVIEQYSAGNLDMLTRIKCLQNKLDLILGKPGSKTVDLHDCKISLASRIVKVERQVDDIENKLDLLTDMYREDQQLRQQHQLQQQQQQQQLLLQLQQEQRQQQYQQQQQQQQLQQQQQQPQQQQTPHHTPEQHLEINEQISHQQQGSTCCASNRNNQCSISAYDDNRSSNNSNTSNSINERSNSCSNGSNIGLTEQLYSQMNITTTPFVLPAGVGVRGRGGGGEGGRGGGGMKPHPRKPMLRQMSDLEPRIKKRVTIGGIYCSSEILFDSFSMSPLEPLHPCLTSRCHRLGGEEGGRPGGGGREGAGGRAGGGGNSITSAMNGKRQLSRRHPPIVSEEEEEEEGEAMGEGGGVAVEEEVGVVMRAGSGRQEDGGAVIDETRSNSLETDLNSSSSSSFKLCD